MNHGSLIGTDKNVTRLGPAEEVAVAGILFLHGYSESFHRTADNLTSATNLGYGGKP